MCNMKVDRDPEAESSFREQQRGKTDGRLPMRGEKRDQSLSTDDCLEKFFSKGEQKKPGVQLRKTGQRNSN